jgi:folate-dependent tRNA-U54 methylase TrmFO/GidA
MVCKLSHESLDIRLMCVVGTTGYEEAAAQGAVAGINAGLAARKQPPLLLTRADGFLGVMIDDLIVKGAEEPCEHLPTHITAYDAEPPLFVVQTGCSPRARNTG